jgi:uncharacterized membrane protein YczE
VSATADLAAPRTPGLVRRLVQLVVACAVLGVGVSLLLDARLGSDGYSTMVNGLTIAGPLRFALVNLVVGVSFVAMAWLRHRPPGLGTVTQVVVVGLVIDLVLPLLPQPDGMVARGAELALAFVVLCVGVAGYLAVDLGAGPAEAGALAWDPPVPFRWSYTGVQGGGALVGWVCGAAVGPGTLLVVLLIGPVVARMLPLLTPRTRRPAAQPGT